MRFLKPCLLLMAVLLSGALSAAAQTTLARKGKPVARIVAADGSSVNRRAAALLQRFVRCLLYTSPSPRD
mgnify:CR=1 FL=1